MHPKLEFDARSDLQNAGCFARGYGAADDPELAVRIGDVGAWGVEVGVVESIKGVAAELEAGAFKEGEGLAEAEIEVDVAGTAQIVAASAVKAKGAGVVGVGSGKV